jgi:hypothetical protein
MSWKQWLLHLDHLYRTGKKETLIDALKVKLEYIGLSPGEEMCLVRLGGKHLLPKRPEFKTMMEEIRGE